MALPMLAGGAECGPSNPLQTLAKRFDQDRGLQQDHFGINRAGLSSEAFRSLSKGPSASNQEAAHFFSASTSVHAPPTFDLSTLHGALPTTKLPVYAPQNPIADWAADFAQGHQLQTPAPSVGLFANAELASKLQHSASAPAASQKQVGPSPVNGAGLQWNMGTSLRMNTMPIPAISTHNALQAQPKTEIDQTAWDKEFTSQELHLLQSPKVGVVESQGQKPLDDLARTAAMLLEQVEHERNPKFKNSQFMDLMRQLRDGRVTVEGNQMIETGEISRSQTDIKGKGRAYNNAAATSFVPLSVSQQAPFTDTSYPVQNQLDTATTRGDANDEYFRQENEAYIRYWGEQDIPPAPTDTISHLETDWDQLQSDWDQLQADWDRSEATATGMKKVVHYQFQTNNPYLLGESSRLQTEHSGYQPTIEGVMELEAVVQRDAKNAMAWYQLGVKQQENEREHRALEALQQAVELDPNHLPSWLALAISYSNDGNRTGAYDAISEWVHHNKKYKEPLAPPTNEDADASLGKRYEGLINCLISIARSNANGEIDADIQIALAVLLNSNEEYDKAQDCFRTALALRPEDWLLYNRVGATMANSGRAEEALEYYYKALELNPGYIRARYNLGISCINLRRFEEAAQHVLDALVLQENDGTSGPSRGVTSSALWDSLKTTCLHMQQVDLATLCDRRDLEGE
ncbi:hypothetical protein M378DRAFT_76152 [Amanita muscaria Koide BX008]|uniref:Uncharacterized protein n=1 Tax=Amanita muscaria (strain Koide BX008) TaxID=946122 RepID=A0A0C2TGD0_AMAMK|nr:hypothetical protein M378DRAFT_76152 [Amanita muscaria Koide BX008]